MASSNFMHHPFYVSVYPSNQDLLSISPIVQDARFFMPPKHMMLVTPKFISYANLQGEKKIQNFL